LAPAGTAGCASLAGVVLVTVESVLDVLELVVEALLHDIVITVMIPKINRMFSLYYILKLSSNLKPLKWLNVPASKFSNLLAGTK